MRRVVLFVCSFCFVLCSAHAQYAPQAGLPGSTAISAGSSLFVAWADQCTVQRGFVDIANAGMGYASLGDSSLATGPANSTVVSLGDGGVAVLTFVKPVFNGPGADFAVFENGFLNTANDSEAFLELAFVEVSSDGSHFVRFPAASLTQYAVQIWNGAYTNAVNLDNLAGKYVANYGTPFDLQQLADSPGLDVDHITHIRLVDVVGSVAGHSSYDKMGRIVNDPYPTPFPSAGFDLDAIGVINQVETGITSVKGNSMVRVYPNPATDLIVISQEVNGRMSAALTTVTGTVLQLVDIAGHVQSISMVEYPAGMYYLLISDANGNRWAEIVTKR